MARRLAYTMKFDVSAAELYQEYTNRDFHEKAMEAFREVTPVSEITRFSSDENGTHVAFRHLVPPDHLPPLVRALLPDLTVDREQFIGPFDHTQNEATGNYRISIPAKAGQVHGTYLLTENGSGSQLRLDSVCNIRIPLVGGILEQLVTSNFQHFFDYEQTSMADWIAARQL